MADPRISVQQRLPQAIAVGSLEMRQRGSPGGPERDQGGCIMCEDHRTGVLPHQLPVILDQPGLDLIHHPTPH